jgi:hypothetical protein
MEPNEIFETYPNLLEDIKKLILKNFQFKQTKNLQFELSPKELAIGVDYFRFKTIKRLKLNEICLPIFHIVPRNFTTLIKEAQIKKSNKLIKENKPKKKI